MAALLNLTEDDLKALCQFWQKRFKLDAWEITLEIVPARDIPEEDAHISYCSHQRTATLQLADDLSSLEEVHEMVVHELLHLFFFFIEPKTVQHILEEQAVHTIAPVFAELHMKSKDPTKPW